MQNFCFISHVDLHNEVYIWGLLKTPWFYSASELYRPSDRSLPAKLVPALADIGCRVVSATDPHGRNLGFLDPKPLLFHSSSFSRLYQLFNKLFYTTALLLKKSFASII
jgi:hypothetical protein